MSYHDETLLCRKCGQEMHACERCHGMIVPQPPGEACWWSDPRCNATGVGVVLCQPCAEILIDYPDVGFALTLRRHDLEEVKRLRERRPPLVERVEALEKRLRDAGL